MFDGTLGHERNGQSDEPAEMTLSWQGIALAFCLTILAIVAAILYPDLFSTPMAQF